MKINSKNQYNQGVSKYKLLSSNAGVGSIVTTKFGTYCMVLDVNKWEFFNYVNKRIRSILEEESDQSRKVKRISKDVSDHGLSVINDLRFIEFLKIEKDLDGLECLVDIPPMSLQERFNTPNWKNHPINQALKENEKKSFPSEFMVKAIHFPKWFIGKKGELKRIEEWYKLWEIECRKHGGSISTSQFAPPRDPNNFVREINITNQEGIKKKSREYRLLSQSNLVLICPNGHISDIPWSSFLNWKSNHYHSDKECSGLFSYDNCCPKPKLFWTESKTKSEGYASVFIHCESCGTGKSDGSKINLEGLNNIKPICQGEKSWEQEIDGKPTINDECTEQMRVALVTANNVYFSNGFSSLFIPMHLAESTIKEIQEALEVCNNKYTRTIGTKFEISKEKWFKKNVHDEFIELDCGINLNDTGLTIDSFLSQLELKFLEIDDDLSEEDFHEKYRFQEFRCFEENNFINENGLVAEDIDLPEELLKFFKRIKKVDELRLSNVQLDFTRVNPRERIVINGKVEYSKDAQNIFSEERQNLHALPAVETKGEGLFFQFDLDSVTAWINENQPTLDDRYQKYLQKPNLEIQGSSTMNRIYNTGVQFFLIHSFSHMIMRELEFSCGYPTASLKERLYVSSTDERKMAGVLIFTAEGSEGSMGGLVSQGEPSTLLDLIKKGIDRSHQCSSDPLCWESEGQGIFDLNLAACFACSLVSETSCEEFNLGLDRRILIDEDFGFFKNVGN